MRYSKLVLNRNITLALPTDLIKRVKIHAAEHDTSVNTFVKELLQEAMSRGGRTREAADRLLALADQGLSFKADRQSMHREDIYERC